MKYTLAFTLSLILSTHSYAHDHNKPDLNGWYEGLMQPGMNGMNRISCCDKQDCHETEADLRQDGIYARLGYLKDGEWVLTEFVKVPEERILKKETNPTGNPVICHSMAWVGTTFAASSVTIYCYIPSFYS